MMGHPFPGFLPLFAQTRGFLLGRPSRAQVTPGGDAVLFLRSPADSPDHDLFEYDVASGQTRRLAQPADILAGAAEEISIEEQARRERQRITDRGFTSFSLSPDGAKVLLPLSGRIYLLARATGKVTAMTPVGMNPVDPRFAPDGKRVAFVSGADLHVVEIGADGLAGPPVAVTSGGHDDLTHGLAEFVAQEEMARSEGYWWSPDSTRLAFAEVDQRAIERFSIADPARPERRPAVFPYPRAGRSNADVRVGLVAARGGAPLWVSWDRARYPYLARVLWDSANAPLAVLVQTRDQREAALLIVDESSGVATPILVERDEAWVNLERDLPRWLPEGNGLLWASERSGRRALELHRVDGTFDRELVSGDDGLLSLCHVSADGRALHVLLGDPLVSRLVRIDLQTGARTTLVDDGGDHLPHTRRLARVWVDNRTAADALPETRVLGTDGHLLGTLPSVAAVPPFRVRLELVETRSDPSFHAALVRPHAFVPGRRYPVVVHVYGGPHSQMVRADERHYLFDQWVADHGCVVVCLDNRGTPRRGRAWERAVKGRFGDLPLDDQALGLEALGRQFPELDLSRVGIYGWSFGGYMAALAVLRRPDLFKVAVAGAPVVDWTDYDTHYTERYLDLPDSEAEAYRSSNLLTYADALHRPLLLIHGTADDNVYFFHSMKLVDALLRAGRPFSFLPLPGVTHQIGDAFVREQVWRRVTDFLLGPLLASG